MGLKETTGSKNETSKVYGVFPFAVIIIDPNYQKSSFLLLNVGGQDSCVLSLGCVLLMSHAIITELQGVLPQ